MTDLSQSLAEVSAFLRALSEPVRLRILSLLSQREACVCEIVPVLRLRQSTVSEHLLILKTCGLIEARKEGKWTHYRLAAQEAGSFSAVLVSETLRACTADASILTDRKRLEETRSREEPTACLVVRSTEKNYKNMREKRYGK